MDTLYELLGALPRDDAETLRAAFRKAVKGAHPDLHPGDPDAAIKFRQIVRANEILLDKDQRAVYDHLLVLAQQEKDPAAAHPIAAKVHKIASTVLALTSLSLVTAGGYFLFMHMSMAWVRPAGHLAIASYAPATNPAGNSDLKARLSASIAAVSPLDAPDPAAVSAFIAARAEGTAANSHSATNAMAMAAADAESAFPPSSAPADGKADRTSILRPHDFLTLRTDDIGGVPAEAERVAQLDQTLTAPYVDRGILFFREKKDGHPFPDLPLLKRAEKPGHPKSLAANDKGHPDAPPKTVPLPVPRTMPRIVAPRPEPWPQQEPWYTAGGG
jgi:curved DNA-binding protein CbpA